MKIFLSTLILAGTTLAFWFINNYNLSSFENLHQNGVLKKPTEINTEAKEGENKEKRKNYFELLHGYTPNWKSINLEIHRAKSLARQNNLNKTYNNYANNHLVGEWRERGSFNQAGNLKVTDFDQQSNTIYAISDGGILWKSDLSGNTWTSLNDGFVLDTRVIKSIRKPDGNIRLLASVGHGLYYSDDEGENWNLCGGFLTNSSNGSAIDLVQLNDNDSTILYLFSQTNAFGNGNNKIAVSTDHGNSFTTIETLNTNNSRVASMCSPYGSSIAYIINKENESFIFKNGTLTQTQTNLNYNGTDFYQVEAVITPTDTTIYVLTDKENLYKSTDETATFTQVGTLPVSSWDCGIGVSSTDPNHIYFGEVELYESSDGGNTFNLVSNWYDYYSDVPNKIHADIMNIQTFEKSDGTEFTLIPNHGGLNVSYDFLASTPNISLFDLNIGQFYDVATSPINSSVIFGGTQDQGFQRTSSGLGGNIIAFDQVISGDYGQQQFTNNGQSIWTQYPGADFSFYQNAATDNSAQFWHNIDGNDMPNYDWIVPTGPAPNASDDYILVGGGNINGGDGSYLIKLWDNFGSAQFSQFPFDFKQASGSTISAIETTSLDEDKWYVSTANGFIYHSEDAGQNWTQSTPFGGPTGNWIYGADIYASKLTPGLVYFGGSGYSNPPVYVSTDGGQNFTAMNNGLPPTVVHELCMDPNENFLFAATDAGPYVYSIAQEEWFDISGNDAPIQEYTTCEFIESENIVRFATWGRGIWDFQIVDASSIEEKDLAENEVSIYPNPAPNGQFKVTSSENYNCVVYNSSGQRVLETQIIKGDNALNFSFLNKGLYIMAFSIENQIILSEQLILK